MCSFFLHGPYPFLQLGCFCVDIVILKNESTKCAFWKLAISESLFVGKDGVARAAIVKVANCEGKLRKLLRRSISYLFPLEINFQRPVDKSSTSKEPNTSSSSDVTESSIRNICARQVAATMERC